MVNRIRRFASSSPYMVAFFTWYRQIFDDDEGGEDAEERRELAEKQREAERALADLSGDSGEESEDNFIVDEEGVPMSMHRKKRHVIHDDASVFTLLRHTHHFLSKYYGECVHFVVFLELYKKHRSCLASISTLRNSINTEMFTTMLTTTTMMYASC